MTDIHGSGCFDASNADSDPGLFVTLHFQLQKPHIVQLHAIVQTHMPLLRKTSNSPEDSDNHRVRADFLPGRDHIGLDVRVTGDCSGMSNVCWQDVASRSCLQ